MLLPALGKARDAARTVSCKSNLSQLAKGMAMYTDDNNGMAPWGDYKVAFQAGLLYKYVVSTNVPAEVTNGSAKVPSKIFFCPMHLSVKTANTGYPYANDGYGYNAEIVNQVLTHISAIKSPSRYLAISESINPSSFNENMGYRQANRNYASGPHKTPMKVLDGSNKYYMNGTANILFFDGHCEDEQALALRNKQGHELPWSHSATN